jgi:hypothetical protein
VLTLANATVVLDHQPVSPPSLGYTRTMHHSSLIEPGDLWRPNPNGSPSRRQIHRSLPGRLTITNEDRLSFHYPTDGLIPTSVTDPGPATTRLPRRWQRRSHIDGEQTERGRGSAESRIG